eukprot:392747-Pyramimonas_sp.AAC.1
MAHVKSVRGHRSIFLEPFRKGPDSSDRHGWKPVLHDIVQESILRTTAPPETSEFPAFRLQQGQRISRNLLIQRHGRARGPFGGSLGNRVNPPGSAMTP